MAVNETNALTYQQKMFTLCAVACIYGTLVVLPDYKSYCVRLLNIY